MKRHSRKRILRTYVQNLTGLTKPETLVDIGKYFGKPAKVWTSSGKEKRAAWLGCSYGSFGLGSGDDLIDGIAARGVRAKKMSGATRT